MLLLCANAFSQTSFSCYYREYCPWNDETEEYEECSGFEEASLFVVNEEETMFVHTTETIKSSYYIDKKEYDEENEVFVYNVTSDVGNKYIYIFDIPNKQIRVVIIKNESAQMARFYVKAMF